ncbi:hypothetical protein ACLKA6_008022 [Drosophila palustris]
MATSDVVKFVVDGLQDKTGAAASLLYCSSLDEMRDKIITYDRIRKSSMPVRIRSEDAKPKSSAAVGQQHSTSAMRCYNCRQFGHYMKDCSQPKRPDGACFKCWSPGHQYLQCPKRKGATTVAAVQDEERMETMKMIVDETMRAALTDNITNKFKINNDDIHHYIGILMYMSIYRYPNLKSYWAKNAFGPIQTCLPRSRFEAIKKYFSLSDESERIKKGEQGYDPLFRTRKLVDCLNQRFDSVPKQPRLCVDEQMCSTKMNHHLRQYMPNKPHKWGIKLFVFCDSFGYAYRFKIYCGAGDNVILPGQPDLGASANIVVCLTQTVQSFKNHIIYFDNFYTSLPLMVVQSAIDPHKDGQPSLHPLNQGGQLIHHHLRQCSLHSLTDLHSYDSS